MATNREYNMDRLRILSCFLIVLLHFSSSYWTCVPIGSYEFTVMTVYNCLTRVGVPVFIMLSGYFLLEKPYATDWKNYLKRPVKMAITFYVWAAFYAFQGLIVEYIRTGSVTGERLEYTKQEMIFGHYHMWFCVLIIGYYFLFPFAKKIAEDMQVLRLFILLWVLFAFALPFVFAWVNCPVVSGFVNGLEMNPVKGYWGYFLLGYYVKKSEWTPMKKRGLYALGLLSLGLTILLTLRQCNAEGKCIETWLSTGSPFVLCMSAALFLVYVSKKEENGNVQRDLLVSVSDSTFFVYMFHIFLLEKMNLLGITTISFNPLLSVPLLSTVAFLISIITARIVKRIPVLGKILTYK